MSFVVDASVAMAWSLPDEESELANKVLFGVANNGALAPDLFIWEIANVLSIAVRRSRLEFAEAEDIFDDIADLGIAFEPVARSRVWAEVFGLSQRHGLSVYDAGYLELARRCALPLATLDKKLAAAAVAEGVSVFGQTG